MLLSVYNRVCWGLTAASTRNSTNLIHISGVCLGTLTSIDTPDFVSALVDSLRRIAYCGISLFPSSPLRTFQFTDSIFTNDFLYATLCFCRFKEAMSATSQTAGPRVRLRVETQRYRSISTTPLHVRMRKVISSQPSVF